MTDRRAELVFALEMGNAAEVKDLCEQYGLDSILGGPGHLGLSGHIARAAGMTDDRLGEEAILEVLRHALAGGFDPAAQLFQTRRSRFLEPVDALIRSSKHRALALLIDHGFDPHKRHNGRSAIAFAKRVDRAETAAMMCACVVRRRVIDALASGSEDAAIDVIAGENSPRTRVSRS